MKYILILCLLAGGVICAAEQPGSALSRLDRTNLLEYHDSKGKVRQGKSLSDWKKRRAEVLIGMQKVMGPLPGKEKRCLLAVRIEQEVDCGTYVRKLISYCSEPNSRVPAYLLVPKSALVKKQRVPAILALHPTDSVRGHAVVVGLGGKAGRQYGVELVERGYVVIAPSYPHLANYAPDLKALGYQSGTMKAIWDNMRALDLLETLPYVKRGSFGAIGHSLGGHNSIYTAVFDPRIRVVVSSSGFDSYLDYMNGNITGWTSERYMPKLNEYRLAEIPFDFHELVGALAPRAFFVNAPKRDANFKWESVDRVVEAARPIYRLYGAEGKMRVEHPDCEHDFPDSMRELAYRVIDQELKH